MYQLYSNAFFIQYVRFPIETSGSNYGVAEVPRHSTMAKWDHAEDTWFWDWDAKLAGKSQAGRVCSTWASFNDCTLACTCTGSPNMLQRLMPTSRRWWGTLWTFAIWFRQLLEFLLWQERNRHAACGIVSWYFENFVPSQGHCYPSKHCWLGRGWVKPSMQKKLVKGRHKVVYHRSKDISPFPLDQLARLEDILRICLQRPMQRAFMQVVCRRSMVSWQLRFLVAMKEHSDTPKRVTTRLLGCKCASFTDISIRCMAYRIPMSSPRGYRWLDGCVASLYLQCASASLGSVGRTCSQAFTR